MVFGANVVGTTDENTWKEFYKQPPILWDDFENIDVKVIKWRYLLPRFAAVRWAAFLTRGYACLTPSASGKSSISRKALLWVPLRRLWKYFRAKFIHPNFFKLCSSFRSSPLCQVPPGRRAVPATDGRVREWVRKIGSDLRARILTYFEMIYL